MLILMALLGCGSNDNDVLVEGLGVETSDKAFSSSPRPPRLIADACPEAPSPDIALTGSSDNYVGCYRLRARGEALIVTDFTLRNIGDDETLESVTIGYYNTAMELVQVIAHPVAGRLDFNGIDLRVPGLPGTDTQIVVYANVDDGTDATPGMTFRLDWFDSGIEIVGGRNGNVYGPEIATNHVIGTEFEWHSTELSFFPAAWSEPSSSATNAERFRYNVVVASTDESGESYMEYGLDTTDNNGVGWNRCIGDFGDGVTNVEGDETFGFTRDDFTLFDTRDLTAPLGNGPEWHLLEADGTECEDDDVVTGLLVDFTSTNRLAPGMAYTRSVYVAATGASAGDVLGMSLKYVEWFDPGAGGTYFGSELLEGFPVEGPMIVFNGS